MDKNFLNKVIDQIVSETIVGKEKINFPFIVPSSFLLTPSSIIYYSIYSPSTFRKHCKEVYGLNDEEIDYVWGYYVIIIKNEIEKG